MYRTSYGGTGKKITLRRVLFYNFVKDIAQIQPNQIEDQIVHIQSAPEGEKLGAFDQHKQAEGKQEKTPEGAQPTENFGEKESTGNKQQDIADQIDCAVANQITVAAVLQDVHIVTDSIEGLCAVISFNLRPIILVIRLAHTEKQKIDHPAAVQEKQKTQKGGFVRFCQQDHLAL